MSTTPPPDHPTSTQDGPIDPDERWTDYSSSEHESRQRSSSPEPDPDPSFRAPSAQLSTTTSSSFSAGSGAENQGFHLRAWPGTRQNWLRLTRDDRDLYKSLERAENDDLSRHLFNAHVLKGKRRSKQTTQHETPKDSWLSKKRWRHQAEWAPHDSWTAWPLEPERVPTRDEAWGTSTSNGHDVEGVSDTASFSWPCMDIGMELEAQMMTFAQQELFSWRVRRAQRPEPSHGGDHEMTCASAGSQEDERSSQDRTSPSGPAQDAGVAQDHHELQNTESEAGASSVIDDSSGSNNGESGPTAYSSDLTPEMLSDEEETSQLLGPAIRQMLPQLDNLLMALHHSRQNQALSVPDASDSGSSKERSRSRGRRTCHRHRNPASSRLRTIEAPRKLGLRDWSEIIGTAALVGWDRGTIQRAASRCSHLFGESISFQVIPSQYTPPIAMEAGAADDGYKPHATDDLAARAGLTVEQPQSGSYKANWICPETQCERHQQPISGRVRWLQHIKSKHGYDYEGPDLLAPPEVDVDWDLAKLVLYCPHPRCTRHKNPFPRWDRLRDHIGKKHGVTVQRSRSHSSRRTFHTSSRPQLSTEEGDADEMVGGVHVDGFLRPVAPGPDRGRKRKRGDSQSPGRSSVSERDVSGLEGEHAWRGSAMDTSED